MSVASSAPDQRHLRLLGAATQVNEARIRDILAEEPSWSSQADRDALRHSLQRIAGRASIELVRLLLELGAEPNAIRDNEVPALNKAAEAGHTEVVRELLFHGANPNWRTRNGHTPLFSSCNRAHAQIVSALLAAGADANVRDKDKRTPLVCIASAKPDAARWSPGIIMMLAEHGADLEAVDKTGRTPLLWAAMNGNAPLVEILLSGELGRKANVEAANNRGRTALHLSAENDHATTVKVLLAHGARVGALSDGDWTPLHNAAQMGNSAVVSLLLGAGADVNAKLSNGMTPLHWAAFNGHTEAVKLLLLDPKADLAARDSFDRTPMLCAAETYHREIAQLLSPARAASRLEGITREACENFEATIVDFGVFREGKKQLVFKHSVYELLYGWDDELDKPKIPTLRRNIKHQPHFRWIHLPANNIAWVQTLLAKAFIEGGARDIDGFKALERCFDQEHRGPMTHAHYMRTYCQRISAPQAPLSEDDDKEPATGAPDAYNGKATPAEAATALASTPSAPNGESERPRVEGKKKGKGEQIAERHPTRPRRKGPPGNAPAPKENKVVQVQREDSKPGALSNKMVVFMPYLHYESDERRRKMSRAIREAKERIALEPNPSGDILLLRAYLRNHQLQPRRTLDQFFYHGIDTSERDTDQVVYRYSKIHHRVTKVFMVDQLWLWVIGKDLIVTSFPQRWEHQKHDPLNMLDGIIEETNAKTRPPIQSILDLAMLITSRCSGLFDRHRLGDEEYQFLDIFESSIGMVNNQESQLFRLFNRASDLTAQWLRHSRGDSRKSPGGAHDPVFPDALLDIGTETSLLAEIKDIRDELNIIAVVLDSQMSILLSFESNITDELRLEGSRRSTDATTAEVRKRSREQKRILETHQKDIDRMDRQAESIYMSLTHLLDLKQKHSNALEARFARDHSVIAARQGQTIMVFTIVTIVFLPMSFIAGFFAINFEDWNGILTVDYVSKYIFGIGLGISIPLIVMAFTIRDLFDAIASGFASFRDWLLRLPAARKGRLPPESAAGDLAEKRPSSRHIPIEELSRGRVSDAAGMSPPSLGYKDIRTAVPPLRLSQDRPFSVSAPHGVSWARSSIDRRRGKPSDDLERGRAGSLSRGY